jgi:hypothetical protein
MRNQSLPVHAVVHVAGDLARIPGVVLLLHTVVSLLLRVGLLLSLPGRQQVQSHATAERQHNDQQHVAGAGLLDLDHAGSGGCLRRRRLCVHRLLLAVNGGLWLLNLRSGSRGLRLRKLNLRGLNSDGGLAAVAVIGGGLE